MPDDSLLKLLVAQAWQIAVLAAIVAVAVRLLAARRPQLAFWLWLIVVLKCVTPPVWGHSLGLFSRIQTAMAVPDEGNPPLTSNDSPGGTEMSLEMYRLTPDGLPATQDVYRSAPTGDILSAQSESFVSSDTTLNNPEGTAAVSHWLPGFCLLLAVGIIGSGILLTCRFVSCLRRIRTHRVTEFDAEIGLLVGSLAKQLNLRRTPQVIVSDVRFGPAVLGIFRHVIVLPKCLVMEATAQRPHDSLLRPILAHELLHIRRGDLWTGTLQAAVQCLWWFHPAVWIVNRRLSRETERCCDEQVIAELDCSPLEYARSLLAVIECKHRLDPVPVFPGMKPVEITSQRMERIMSLSQGSRWRMPLWSSIAVALFAVVVLPGAVTGQQTAEPGNAVTEGQLIDTPSEADALTHQIPPKLRADITGPELVEYLNTRTSGLERWQSTSAKVFIRMPNVPVQRLAGYFACQAPDCFRLNASNVISDIDLGANNQRCWVSVQPGESAVFTWKHEHSSILAQKPIGVPIVDVNWLMVVLGVTPLDPNDYEISAAPESNELWLTATDRADSGRPRRRVIKVDAMSGEIHEHAVYDTEQKPLVRAQLSKYRHHDGKQIPEAVSLLFPQDGFELTLTFNGIETNPDLPAVLWEIPDRGNGKVVDLSRIVATAEAEVHGFNSGSGVKSDADVTGRILSDRPIVRIIGAVNKPGAITIPTDRPFRFLDAVAAAGGTMAPVDDRVILRRPKSNGDQVVVLRSLKAAGRDSRRNSRLGPGDVLVVERAAQPDHLSAVEKEMKDDLDQLVSFSFQDAPFVEAVRRIATDCGVNIVVEKRAIEAGEALAEPTVTLTAQQVSLRTALGQLCRQLGFEFETHAEVIEIRRQNPVATRLITRVYNVADLVVPIPQSLRSLTAGAGSQEDVLRDKMVSALYAAGKTDASNGEGRASEFGKADFEGLIELIRTTVEPHSWGEWGVRVTESRETLSLVIRQSDAVHLQIVDLMRQLRSLQKIQINTNCVVLEFETEEQLNWLDLNVTFHQHAGANPWALLPKDGTHQILNAARQRSETLSATSVTAFVGQSTFVRSSGALHAAMHLVFTGVPVEGDNQITLSYGVAFGDVADDLVPSVNRVMANGQTLLLDVTNAAQSQDSTLNGVPETEQPPGSKTRFNGRTILAITPSILRAMEELELKLDAK